MSKSIFRATLTTQPLVYFWRGAAEPSRTHVRVWMTKKFSSKNLQNIKVLPTIVAFDLKIINLYCSLWIRATIRRMTHSVQCSSCYSPSQTVLCQPLIYLFGKFAASYTCTVHFFISFFISPFSHHRLTYEFFSPFHFDIQQSLIKHSITKVIPGWLQFVPVPL